jgi:hypothetical protein
LPVRFTFSAWGFALAASSATLVVEVCDEPFRLLVEFPLRVALELLVVRDEPFLPVVLFRLELLRLAREPEERVV